MFLVVMVWDVAEDVTPLFLSLRNAMFIAS